MNVFLDLDGTLVRMDRKSGKYCADGNAYAPMHGCNQFLLALGSIPGVKISFYSLGSRFRNKQLVKELVDDSISLVKGATPPGLKQYNVFSQEHTDKDGGKRLRSISICDMNQRVMVDDFASVVCVRDEEKHFIPVYSGDFQFNGAGAAYPGCLFNTRRENNLVRVLGMLLWCLKMCKSDDNLSLVEALTNLQWNSTTCAYRHRETNSIEIYYLGLEAMRRFTPNFQLLDTEKSGFLPWLPPLAKLNTGYKVHVILWYQHFGFDEDQVQRVLDSFFELSLPLDDLRRSKVETVEVLVGDLCLKLPAALTADMKKAVAKDIMSYGLDRNFEFINRAPGQFSLVLQTLELCDFDC